MHLPAMESDGPHFGEGPFSAIQQDQIGGPVLDAATQVLTGIVDLPAK